MNMHLHWRHAAHKQPEWPVFGCQILLRRTLDRAQDAGRHSWLCCAGAAGGQYLVVGRQPHRHHRIRRVSGHRCRRWESCCLRASALCVQHACTKWLAGEGCIATEKMVAVADIRQGSFAPSSVNAASAGCICLKRTSERPDSFSSRAAGHCPGRAGCKCYYTLVVCVS